MKEKLSKFMVIVMTIAILGAVTPVYALDYTEAQICVHLGMLEGEGYGVTESYLAKETTRMQAAIMHLRLLGLEDEALVHNGDKNFIDANDMLWEGGRRIMSYLKDNPDIGWVGYTDGSFKPNQKISAKEYYKVMLELLGYKEDVDFTWSNLFDFAAIMSFGDHKDVQKFTNNDVAKVTVEALKMKDMYGDVLIERLIGSGYIELEDAIEVGLVVTPVNDMYGLEFVISDENGKIPSDGMSSFVVSVLLYDKVTSEYLEVDGEVKFEVTDGILLRESSMMLEGQASNRITAPIFNEDVEAYVTATITSNSGVSSYNGVTGQLKFVFSPDEIADEMNIMTQSVYSIESNQADRFYVTYTGTISAEAYKQALMDEIPGINSWENMVLAGTNGGMFIDGHPIYIEDIIQKGSNSLEFILNTDQPGSVAPTTNRIKSGWVPTNVYSYLMDNYSHTMTIPQAVGKVVYASGMMNFIMTDTAKPYIYDATSINAHSYEIKCSESVAEDSTETASRGVLGVNGATVFTPGMPGHNEDFLFDGKNVYLVNDVNGATDGEKAFAQANNLVLIRDLYVGKYDLKEKVDTRNIIYLNLDASVNVPNGQHQIQISKIEDWAGLSDVNNVSTTQTIDVTVSVQ